MSNEISIGSQWIVSKKDDLFWIIGSSGVSLFLLLVYFSLTSFLPLVSGIEISGALIIAIIFLLWTLVFDSTHFFATYSRTFLDAQFLKENKAMLYSSLIIFFIGPAYLLTSLFFENEAQRKAFAYSIFALIILGSILWGYFHLVRQHWGFVALYQKKNKESSSFQYNLDASLLFLGTLWPFVFYLENELLSLKLMTEILQTSHEPFFSTYLLILSFFTLLFGLALKLVFNIQALAKLFQLISALVCLIGLFLFSGIHLSLDIALSALEIFFRYLFIACLLLYCVYTFFINTHRNLPKFLLLASVILTYNLVLLSVTDFLLISACLTIFHNIQYHRIVRYFNVNHYTTPGTPEHAHGLAALLTEKLYVFIALALVFSIVVFVLRGSTTLVESGLIKMILITSIINGVSLHHYFIDGLIWRTSKDQSLSSSLKLTN